jgi:hypothetical protein
MSRFLKFYFDWVYILAEVRNTIQYTEPVWFEIWIKELVISFVFTNGLNKYYRKICS